MGHDAPDGGEQESGSPEVLTFRKWSMRILLASFGAVYASLAYTTLRGMEHKSDPATGYDPVRESGSKLTAWSFTLSTGLFLLLFSPSGSVMRRLGPAVRYFFIPNVLSLVWFPVFGIVLIFAFMTEYVWERKIFPRDYASCRLGILLDTGVHIEPMYGLFVAINAQRDTFWREWALDFVRKIQSLADKVVDGARWPRLNVLAWGTLMMLSQNVVFIAYISLVSPAREYNFTEIYGYVLGTAIVYASIIFVALPIIICMYLVMLWNILGRVDFAYYIFVHAVEVFSLRKPYPPGDDRYTQDALKVIYYFRRTFSFVVALSLALLGLACMALERQPPWVTYQLYPYANIALMSATLFRLAYADNTLSGDDKLMINDWWLRLFAVPNLFGTAWSSLVGSRVMLGIMSDPQFQERFLLQEHLSCRQYVLVDRMLHVSVGFGLFFTFLFYREELSVWLAHSMEKCSELVGSGRNKAAYLLLNAHCISGAIAHAGYMTAYNFLNFHTLGLRQFHLSPFWTFVFYAGNLAIMLPWQNFLFFHASPSPEFFARRIFAPAKSLFYSPLARLRQKFQ